MSALLTDRTIAARRRAREALATGLADLGWSQRQLAGAVEQSESRVAQWVAGTAHTPLYLLAHELVPEGLRARLRALAPEVERASVSLETTSALLVADIGATLHSLGGALLDRRLTPDERRVLAPLVRALRARCDQWLARHGGEQ